MIYAAHATVIRHARPPRLLRYATPLYYHAVLFVYPQTPRRAAAAQFNDQNTPPPSPPLSFVRRLVCRLLRARKSRRRAARYVAEHAFRRDIADTMSAPRVCAAMRWRYDVYEAKKRRRCARDAQRCESDAERGE